MRIMIPCQRDLFDIPADEAYLNCAYMSPLPRSVRAAGEKAAARKARPWEIAPADFFSESETARALFAHLIGAQADDIAIVPSVSYGLGVAAANLPLGRGQKIILLAEQFPSNVYVWREAARETGAELVVVPRPADQDWTQAVIAAIDASTAIAALPNCHWTDGGLIDLVAVGAVCRGNGAALVIDATQSLGALALDVTAVRPDFLVSACYKWLLGPYSLGFLYAAPERQAGRPLEHNWIARAGAEDFAGLVNYRDEFQRGARRYDMGERSNFGLMPMAIAALNQIMDWRVPVIQATLAALTRRIAGQARALGLEAVADDKRAGHFLGLRFPRGLPDGLAKRLAQARVHVSVRGESLRVTPHLYNNDDDIERLIDVLAATL